VRRLTLIALLATALASPASANAAERLSASPSTVAFGQTLTLQGRGWPVIEFCSRKVHLSLNSSQNSFRIGTARTRTNGKFTFHWVPRRARVGAGRWTVVARMRCESGENGSPVIRRASDRIRIAAKPFIETSPGRVRRGELVRVFGAVPGCPRPDQVTLISEAFPGPGEFAGLPAVYTPVRAGHRFSVRVRIPSDRNPGRYSISGRCGGGGFGNWTLTVTT
jgi:hypothetical protein